MKLLLILLLSFPVYAEVKTGTFIPPTTRMDGTSLSQSDIKYYRMYLDGQPAGLPLPNTAITWKIDMVGTALI